MYAQNSNLLENEYDVIIDGNNLSGYKQPYAHNANSRKIILPNKGNTCGRFVSVYYFYIRYYFTIGHYYIF